MCRHDDQSEQNQPVPVRPVPEQLVSLKGANSTRSAHLTTWIWGCSFLSHFTIKFLTCCLRVRLKSRPASYLVGGRISRTVNT